MKLKCSTAVYVWVWREVKCTWGNGQHSTLQFQTLAISTFNLIFKNVLKRRCSAYLFNLYTYTHTAGDIFDNFSIIIHLTVPEFWWCNRTKCIKMKRIKAVENVSQTEVKRVSLSLQRCAWNFSPLRNQSLTEVTDMVQWKFWYFDRIFKVEERSHQHQQN